jgi:4,5-DOPA dioxygenase extradiol
LEVSGGTGLGRVTLTKRPPGFPGGFTPLRDEGVLIIGSGSFTHDLSEYFRHRNHIDAAEPDWVRQFADWFDAALHRLERPQLIAYRAQAPFAAKNHPTEEHLMPLFVALGAAADENAIRRLHTSATYGVLRMDAYAFGAVN